MTTRREGAGAASGAPGSPAIRAATRPLGPDDERLNDDINALLREAAEQLELRTQAEAAEDTAAARRQFDAVVALARARARKPAADPTRQAARRTGH
jgi:ElaB/YqjD/DUF883 family membrane-anchored ribosome-binding protein